MEQGKFIQGRRKCKGKRKEKERGGGGGGGEGEERKQTEGHAYPNHLYKHLEIFHLLRSSPAMLKDQPC